MFREFSPEDVVGKIGVFNCVKIDREWKSRKSKMENASRLFWTENEISLRGAVQLREDFLKGILGNFSDD